MGECVEASQRNKTCKGNLPSLKVSTDICVRDYLLGTQHVPSSPDGLHWVGYLLAHTMQSLKTFTEIPRIPWQTSGSEGTF